MTGLSGVPPTSGDKRLEMVENAKGALRWVLKLKEGEDVLVVTDRERFSVGSAFHQAAEQLGARSEVFILPQNKRPLFEIPRYLSEFLKNRDVLINTLTSLAEETPFRIKLVKAGIAMGARVGHGPGITDSMMGEGPMSVDYLEVAANGRRLMAAFENGERVHVTAPAGTDISFSILDRAFETDMEVKPGHMGNLPPGEVWCAPLERSADGVIVSDGSVGDLGQVPSNVVIEVAGGRIASISGGDSGFLGMLKKLTSVDDMASVIGEFGIGINPKARITGNLLEDEKAGRTAHIAFGNNETMPGGKNSSRTHRDFLFHKPTIRVTYEDGTERMVMRDGDVSA